MVDVGDTSRADLGLRIGRLLAERGGLLRDYLAAVSGSAGRLVFSLLYFVALANSLSISDFGLFATASAAGVMLSRIVAFGFISALYRTATVRPRLIGTFTAGFLLMTALSIPVLAIAAVAVYLFFFAHELAPLIFALIVFAEALLWRPFELAAIVNNGLGRFARAAVLVIIGTMLRALAAVLFAFWPVHTLQVWAEFYVAANAAALIVAFAFFYPRQRLRFRTPLYWRKLTDSLYVAGAEILFYVQMELDKLLVLAMGGPKLAGIYAIVMRLVDLTAIPIRAFTMMLVQSMMRAPKVLERLATRAIVELGVFLVSTSMLIGLAVVLYVFPNALGRNVAPAAGMIMLALCVPGFRNLVEYQAELLFARGQTLIRAVNLALLAGLKALLLTWVLTWISAEQDLIWSLNGVFAALYLISLALTYTAMRWPARPV